MIGGPIPQQPGKPITRLLLPVAALLVVAAAAAITRVPPPGPARFYTRLVVIHDTLLPARVTSVLPFPEKPPEVQSTLTSVLDNVRVDTWVVRQDRQRMTVHRVHGHPSLPANAQPLARAGEQYSVFELEDLTLLAWVGPGDQLHLVVGTAPIPQMVIVADWHRTLGPGA